MCRAFCCCSNSTKQKQLAELLPEEFFENDTNLVSDHKIINFCFQDEKLLKFGKEFTGKGPDDAQSELLKKAYESNMKHPGKDHTFMDQYFAA